ncbi:hypothetical protein GCM10025857_05940 [Alicyclobacillus contaminans]|nr:hypothetical protein GCM10025857_05940 [Alicyclobacillus contaminans]
MNNYKLFPTEAHFVYVKRTRTSAPSCMGQTTSVPGCLANIMKNTVTVDPKEQRVRGLTGVSKDF